MIKNGVLITLEGNEGSGKSTQIRLLQRYFKKRGLKVFLTREPGGTRIGDKIREILLDRKNTRMTPETETLLYMAARGQLVSEVILPKLKQGYVVLCDRWLDATVAYQGYGANVDVDWIRDLGRQMTRGVRPKLSLFLDLPLVCGLRRAKARKKADRMEKKALAFHRRVRRGYLAIAKIEPRRFVRVPIREDESIGEVHLKVKKQVERYVG